VVQHRTSEYITMQSKGMHRSLNTAGTVIDQTALGRRDRVFRVFQLEKPERWAGTINVSIAIEMV